MRKGLIGAIVAAVVATFPAVPAVASGGGGCGGPVTQETGDAVAIRQFCFEPTILVVPGEGQVTFTNRDGFPHNVLGANASWGSFARMNDGKTRAFSFDEPGVYPYVCSWHPGMVGAVVVGGGDLPAGAIDAEAASRLTAGGRPEAGRQSSAWMVVALAAGGLLLLVLIGTAGLRRRLGQNDQV
jgi:plastocyanin